MIANIDVPFKEFRDYYEEKIENIVEKTNFIPFVAYIQERDGKLKFYFIKEVKSEFNKEEIEEALDFIGEMAKMLGEDDDIPTLDIGKTEFYSKKDLNLINNTLMIALKKGFIRIIANNIDNIIKDKPPVNIQTFIKLINFYKY